MSTVVAFFNLAPFLISPNNASLPGGIEGGGPGGKFPKLGGGGGGGGRGGGPAILLYVVICLEIQFLTNQGCLLPLSCVFGKFQKIKRSGGLKNQREKMYPLLMLRICTEMDKKKITNPRTHDQK